jgi:hypothetical protein
LATRGPKLKTQKEEEIIHVFAKIEINACENFMV